MTPDPRTPRTNGATLAPVLLVVFVDVLGFTVVIPLLPFYAEHFGASPATIGLLISTYAVCGLPAAPLLGRWSDRYGRKPILLLSQLGTFAGFVLLALAPSLAWVFVARAVDGITAANIATARAYIADVTPRERRTRAFGWIAAAFGLGYLLGPAAAGVLAHYGLRVPLWVAAGLSAISIAATSLLLPDRKPPPASVGSRHGGWTLLWQREPGLRLWQLFGFLFAFSTFTAGFALFCERRLRWHDEPFDASQVGLVLAYLGALGLVVQLGLLQPLVRRCGEARLVSAGLTFGAVAYAGLAVCHTVDALLLALTFVALANGVLRPSLLGLISLQTPATRQGAAFGMSQMLQLLAMIFGPLVAGGLIERGWLSGWALACAVPLVLALAARPPRPRARAFSS